MVDHAVAGAVVRSGDGVLGIRVADGENAVRKGLCGGLEYFRGGGFVGRWCGGG